MLETLLEEDQKKRMVVGLIARGKLYTVEEKLKLAENDLRMAVLLVQQNFPLGHPDLINPMQALGQFLVSYGDEMEGKQYQKSASDIATQIELEFQ
jgi:hypothetical protein